MAKVLILGGTGFAGSHLADYLLNEHNVFIGVRWRSPMNNISHCVDKLKLVDADIRDQVSIVQLLKKIRPNYIFHLAAQSFVPQSWKAPGETMFTNVIGTLNVLEAVKELGLDCVVHIAGSSEEYGLVKPDEAPIKETNQLRPLSPYGVSKVACDLMAQQYHKSYGLKTVITRAFNHEGERRGKPFVTSNFAWQVAMIEQGLQEPAIKVGNLDAERDFTDVHDMVKAYWLAATMCEYGTPYNICSGKAWRIGDMLDYLINLSRGRDIVVEYDAERGRPSDVPLLLGDCTKFKNQTGWQPIVPFTRTLENTLNYWRKRDLRIPVEVEA